ncbi:MAG: hypothetical protein AAFY15_01540 [Cyanobacteria bacterium J06648_11]
MAYDYKTYGASPFDSSQAAATAANRGGKSSQKKQQAQNTEALSDYMEDSANGSTEDADPSLSPAEDTSEARAEETSPALPTTYAPVLKSKASKVSLFYLPKGRVTGLSILGEGFVWLLGWGTVGFFRAYVPKSALLIFDALFTPWGMAGGTLLSALLVGQLLRRYELKLGSLRTLATTAIEYGESHHRADAQNDIYQLLTEAEARTQKASSWVVSWLLALSALFVIGSFY